TATVQVADMLSIPYPDAYFDWVLSVQVIYHTTVATLQQALHHVHAKLKPGGWLYVTFAPVENITAASGREIEPRTYLHEEDGEPLLHHYVLPEEIDTLLEGVLKIPVTICNVPSVKMSWADFQGILEIASLPEGPLKHKNVLISGISKHALRPYKSLKRVRHAGSLLTCWVGVSQVGREPEGSHPLGNNNLFQETSPKATVSG